MKMGYNSEPGGTADLEPGPQSRNAGAWPRVEPGPGWSLSTQVPMWLGAFPAPLSLGSGHPGWDQGRKATEKC